MCSGRRRSTNYPKRSSRKGSRLTTIRHGGPCGLRSEMRSAERPGNLAICDVTLAAKCPEHPQRGGCYMGFGLGLPQPHSSICLIPLWLAALKRPLLASDAAA